MFSAVEVFGCWPSWKWLEFFPFLACDCILLQVKPKQGIEGAQETRGGDGDPRRKREEANKISCMCRQKSRTYLRSHGLVDGSPPGKHDVSCMIMMKESRAEQCSAN